MMPYLIDGHNLISKLPDINLHEEHDEVRLVHKLRGFSVYKRKQCIVIFDEGLPGGKSPLSTHSVQVVFAASQQTNADNVIRERIQNTPDPANWTVVSSDNEVLAAATHQGMRPLLCRDFAKILMRPIKPPAEAGTEVHVQLSGSEVTKWMNEFETIDPDTLPAPDQPKKSRSHHQIQSPSSESETPPRTIPLPEKGSKIPRVRPEMKTDENAHLTRNDVASWEALFAQADEAPLPELDKPRDGIYTYREDGTVVRRRPEKNRHRKQNRESITPEMKDDENLYLSQDDIDEWLNVFGDEGNA